MFQVGWMHQLYSLISSCWCLSDAVLSAPLAQKHDSIWIQGLGDRADPLRGSTGICGPAAGRLQCSAPQLCPGLLRNGDWLSGACGNIPAVPLLTISINLFVLFVPCLVSAPAGVWHLCEVRAAASGDASGWSLLSSPVGHWPCWCGQTGLHHVQVGQFQLFKIPLIRIVKLLPHKWLDWSPVSWVHCNTLQEIWLGFVFFSVVCDFSPFTVSVFCSGTRWTWHQPRIKKQSER